MRLYPKGQFQDYETADSIKNNKVLNGYADVVNGNLTGINFGHDTIRREERANQTFYKVDVFTDTTPITLQGEQIRGGIYIIPEYTQYIEFKDGVVIGGLNLSFLKYGYEEYNPLYPIAFGDNYVRFYLYLDGNVVAETDRLYNRNYTINLPFMFQTTAGTHTIQVGVKALAFGRGEMDSANGKDQMEIYGTHQFYRNIIR